MTAMTLRTLVRERATPLLLPGVPNALAARVIEDLGFEAVYVSGAGIANTFLGAPDVGLITLTELEAHVSAIRDAVEIPIVVDADTGFGNALNVRRTVRALGRAGANGIQLEDQVAPKRCGHFAGKAVIPVEEMVGKIHAVTDNRPSEEMLLIARTDARAISSLDEACERAQRYLDEGADVAFVEAPLSVEELRYIGTNVNGLLLANIVEGALTPQLPLADLGKLGFDIILYANSAMRAAVTGMSEVLSHLKREGDTIGVLDRMITWDERQTLVRKPAFDELERRYATEN
jgi:2-methylisocitrate lyase-like PEP mutase family enzyme